MSVPDVGRDTLLGTRTERIRVLHVYKYLYHGGTERYIRTLVRHMNPRSYSFSVCCLLEAGPAADAFRAEGAEVFVLSVQRRLTISALLHNVAQLVALARLLRTRGFEIVHTHDNFPAAYARVAAWLARTPLVYVTYHSTYEWLSPLHRRVNRFLARLTTRIVAVSQAVKERSRTLDRIPDEKYQVIYSGVEAPPADDKPEPGSRCRRELGLPDHAVVLGNVSRLSRRKGQTHLVEAFGRIAPAFPDTILVIVGGATHEEPGVAEELEELAERYGVRERVVLTGFRRDASSLIRIFDLFVMPSEVEGFGYALVEAMIAGVPAVVSDIAAFREISANGTLARMACTSDVEDLTRQIRIALSDPEEMRRMAEEARRSAVDRFSIDEMIARYDALYQADLKHVGLR